MRFSAQFEASQYSEWRKKYLRYNSIKQHIDELFPLGRQRKQHSTDEIDAEIDRIVEQTRTRPAAATSDASTAAAAASSTSTSASALATSSQLNYGAASDSSSSALLSLASRGDTIMTKLLSDLHKIDNFYRAVEAELESGFKTLQAQINIINSERTRRENGRRELRQAAGMSGSASSADIHGLNSSLNSSLNHSLNSSGSGHDSAASSPVESPTDGDIGYSVPVPAESAMHHSYSTGTFPLRTSSSSPTDKSTDTQQLPPAAGINHSTSSVTATLHPHQPPIRTTHLPSSYSYYSHKHHLTIHAANNGNHSASSAQQQQQHSASATTDSHHHHSAFTSHLLHPLHPDAAHKAHSVSTEQLSTALLPLRSTFIHLLRRMTMLIHYVDINRYAFTRLIVLFSARSTDAARADKFDRLLKAKYVFSSRKLEDELIPATYQLFADCYEHGNLEHARVFLLARLSDAEYDQMDTFFLGLKIGIIMMLAVWNLMVLIQPTQLNAVASLSLYAPIYRCTGLLVLWLWLWGVCVLVFDTYRISYVFVFQLNPRNRLTHFSLFNEASNITIAYLVNSLLLISHYEQALDAHVSSHIYPISLLAFFFIKLLTPSTLISYWHTRSTLLATVASVVTAPFGSVTFRDTYVGDVLTSMVKVLVDVEYSIALLLSLFVPAHAGTFRSVATFLLPFVSCLPLWFRFQQCLKRYYDTRSRWPHLMNALKYAVAHSVVIVSAFHPSFTDHHSARWELFRSCWLVSTVASSLYTTAWDVTQDWGLGGKVLEAEAVGLRAERLFPSVWFYYWCVSSNFFLRFGWVLTLVPFSLFEPDADPTAADATQSGAQFTYLSFLFQSQSVLVTLLTALELLRRFQWTLLRVEWEHLCRGSGFRLSHYVPMLYQQKVVGDGSTGGGAGGTGELSGGASKVRRSSAGVVLEVVMMVVIVLIVAVLGAIM